MDIHSYTRVGNSYIALDAQENVVGVLKPLDSATYQKEIEALKTAHRRLNDESIQHHASTRRNGEKIIV